MAMGAYSKQGVEKLLLSQLERELRGLPPDVIRRSLEPDKRGGRTRMPKTRDPLLLQGWAMLEATVRTAHHEISCAPSTFIRLFQLDEIYGSIANARRQLYRLLGLNGHRLPRPRTTRLILDPASGDLPANVVRRQRAKPN